MQTEITYEHLNAIASEMSLIMQNYPTAYKYIFPRVDAFFKNNKDALALMEHKVKEIYYEYVEFGADGHPMMETVPSIITSDNQDATDKQQLKMKKDKDRTLFELANKELQKKFVKVEL